MSYVSEPVWRWGELKSSPLRRRWSFTVSPVISTPSKLCANAGKSCPQKLSRHIHFVLSISAPSNSSCHASVHFLSFGRSDASLPGTGARRSRTMPVCSIFGSTKRASAAAAARMHASMIFFMEIPLRTRTPRSPAPSPGQTRDRRRRCRRRSCRRTSRAPCPPSPPRRRRKGRAGPS